MLCTGAPNVTVCPTFAVLSDGNFVINLTITDQSDAPASGLTVTATGLLDSEEVELPFSLPVLPMKAVIIPSVVVVANDSVDATMFTLVVSAKNKVSETVKVFSANYTYPPCEPSAWCTNNVVFTCNAIAVYIRNLFKGKFCTSAA